MSRQDTAGPVTFHPGIPAAAWSAAARGDGGRTSIAARTSCPPEWLELREHADAEARSAELLPPLRAYLVSRASRASGVSGASRVSGERPYVIRDLGCGTGAMGRWLAGRLPGPQRWVLHDRDPVLLDLAARSGLGSDAGGGPVAVAAERRDVTRPLDLAGTSLVTASALLDLLTGEEVDVLAAACAAAGCAALLALSVTGAVALSPADPLDAAVEAAFNAHQRRVVGGRRLLGPDAPAVAAAAFNWHGMTVRWAESAWRLGRGPLTAEWLRGRAEAAAAQCPGLPVRPYLRRRLEACAAGRLSAVVGHVDLLALPGV